MDVTKAEEHARLQMDLCGLADWKLEFDTAVNRLGQCRYRTQTISMSRILIEANDEEMFWDTLLHEIAHALVGPEVTAHGREWKAQARELGIEDPAAGVHELNVPDEVYRYEGTCAGTHERPNRFRRHRMSRRHNYNCNICKTTIQWYDRKLGIDVPLL